jgi:hypothetical protein
MLSKEAFRDIRAEGKLTRVRGDKHAVSGLSRKPPKRFGVCVIERDMFGRTVRRLYESNPWPYPNEAQSVLGCVPLQCRGRELNPQALSGGGF